MSGEKALRFNAGKIQLNQVPPELEWAVAAVLMASSDEFQGKYPKNNWQAGAPYSQNIECIKRHLDAFRAGEDKARDSRLKHTWHLATNAMFLLWNEIHHPENDDRTTKYPLNTQLFIDAVKEGEFANLESKKALVEARENLKAKSWDYKIPICGSGNTYQDLPESKQIQVVIKEEK